MLPNRFTNHLSRLGTPPAGRSSFDGESTSKIGGGEAKFTKAQLGPNIVVVRAGEDIQLAIEKINDTGGGKVFLRNGTHYPNNDIVLYSDITLEGESTYGTIIDFGSQSYSVRIEGSDAYSDGTISVTQGGTTVTGSGTVWTSEMEGQTIAIDGDTYEIISVNSETELSISTGFAGTDQAGLSYIICTTIDGNHINKLTVQNSATHLIKVRYALVPKIENVETYGGDTAIDIRDSWGIFWDNGGVMDCAKGIYCENTFAYTFQGFYIFNCTGNGMEFNGGGDSTLYNFGVTKCDVGMKFTDTVQCSILSFTVDNNVSHGIEFVSGNADNGMVMGIIATNGGDGVKYTATSDRNIINGIQIRDNTLNGVNVAAADCDNNIIISNIFSGNGSDAVADSGTGTLIRSNIGQIDN